MADFVGTIGSDSLNGGAEADKLDGLEGDDTLNGRAGFDTLTGGVGNDVYKVDYTVRPDGQYGDYDLVTEAAGEGIDTVVYMGGAHWYILPDNVENLIGTGGGHLVGNGLGNVISGSHDIEGLGGDDTLTGYRGDDTLKGGDGDDVLAGYDPELLGDDRSWDRDVLDGGAGADTMIGGGGMDFYIARDLGDVVIEQPDDPRQPEDDWAPDILYWMGEGDYAIGENVDWIHLREGATAAHGGESDNVIYSDYGSYTYHYTLYEYSGSYLEHGSVSLDGGGGDDALIGGDYGDDTLSGGVGDDRLEGNDGNDLIHGGDGDDWIGKDGNPTGVDYAYGEGGDDWTQGDYAFGGDGDDVVFGRNETGGAGRDNFTGYYTFMDFTDGEDFIRGEWSAVQDIRQDGADTVIVYEGGEQRLIGFDAANLAEDDFMSWIYGFDSNYNKQRDTLTGGAGSERLDGGGGNDVADGGDSDDIVIGGNGDDRVSGGQGADTVDGGDGNDLMAGGAGADLLKGGRGDDTFVIDDSFDSVVENADSGVDTVEALVSLTLSANIENLILGDAGTAAARMGAGAGTTARTASAGAVDGTGNGLGNAITGSSGDNGLWGLGGADRIDGGAGKDRLFGGAGDDVLKGGDGRDQLVGGAGRDLLSGGRGADTFAYVALRDGVDRIRDFRAAQGDQIDLSRLDADAHAAGDQAFHFVSGFGGHAGEAVLTYEAAQGRTVLRLDVDGDAHSDFSLVLDGQVSALTGWVL